MLAGCVLAKSYLGGGGSCPGKRLWLALPQLGRQSNLCGKAAYSGGNFYPRPAVVQPVRPAIEEQVAALLEARPFDSEKAFAAGDNQGGV